MAIDEQSSTQSYQSGSHTVHGHQRREKVDDVTSVIVSTAVIQPVSSIQSLGVALSTGSCHFTNKLTTFLDCAIITSGALWHIRESLPEEVVKTVACSLMVITLATATLFSLECKSQSLTSCKKFRTPCCALYNNCVKGNMTTSCRR